MLDPANEIQNTIVLTSDQMKVQVQIGVQKNRKKNWNKK